MIEKDDNTGAFYERRIHFLGIDYTKIGNIRGQLSSWLGNFSILFAECRSTIIHCYDSCIHGDASSIIGYSSTKERSQPSPLHACFNGSCSPHGTWWGSRYYRIRYHVGSSNRFPYHTHIDWSVLHDWRHNVIQACSKE